MHLLWGAHGSISGTRAEGREWWQVRGTVHGRAASLWMARSVRSVRSNSRERTANPSEDHPRSRSVNGLLITGERSYCMTQGPPESAGHRGLCPGCSALVELNCLKGLKTRLHDRRGVDGSSGGPGGQRGLQSGVLEDGSLDQGTVRRHLGQGQMIGANSFERPHWQIWRADLRGRRRTE